MYYWYLKDYNQVKSRGVPESLVSRYIRIKGAAHSKFWVCGIESHSNGLVYAEVIMLKVEGDVSLNNS